jgi:hypothetical protein
MLKSRGWKRGREKRGEEQPLRVDFGSKPPISAAAAAAAADGNIGR